MDSIKLPQASIWGGISWNGESISITTTSMVNGKAHLFLRKLDTLLNQVQAPIQITLESDHETRKGLTDHKHIFLNGNHFVTFSVVGDSDLYVFRLDKNGQRIGAIVPVIEGTANRTNDMFHSTDGQLISVGYFKPPSQSEFHRFDQSLSPVGSPITTSSVLPHNNIGGVVFKDGVFFMFTGNIFGKNANLILTKWNSEWSPAAATAQTLISSMNGDGNWFATGAVYQSNAQRWFLAFQHIYASDPSENEHIDLAVFDDTFKLLECRHVTPSRTYRPQILIQGNSLYLIYDSSGGGVFIHRYALLSAPQQAIDWKLFFTLRPEEGVEFVVDTTAIVPGGGVPVINITNAGKIVLTSTGGPQLQTFEVSADGKSYLPLPSPLRGPDGGFVYLPDGRTRFLSEEPAPDKTPQRHKSRIMSWISTDGLTWTKEEGIRYQPGIEDDSISSVPSVIQVKDSIWRMYFVGDFYRSNGTRTAISYDWGRTWQKESISNILRRGDVDPHPVYLTDGRIRLYFRSGMNKPPDQAGVSYCESDDGLQFDTLKTKLLISDQAMPTMLKLDPAVLKLPNGEVVCYIGAAPFIQHTGTPKLIAAWAVKTAVSVFRDDASLLPETPQLLQNYPNPFNAITNFEFRIANFGFVSLKVFDLMGRKVKALFRRVAIISVGSVFLLYPSAQAFQPLHLLKKVVITSDAEGGSARPEIVATPNRVFVLYLGNIAAGSERTFNLKSYDRNLDTVIASRVLVSSNSQYGDPTDIRIAADGQYLFAFYETHKTTSPTTATTYLWGAKYTLDDSMQRVAATSTYIASSKPMSELQDGGELLDDPAPLVGPSSVFVVTRLRYALATAGRTIYRVREFSKNDLAKLSEFDLDLSSAAKGRGRVASLLFWNNNIYMALATTVSDVGVNEGNDDGALSDIISVRLRQDWTFDSSIDVRVLSAEPNDRENYVTGFRIEGGYFYLTYKQAVGSPPSGQQIAWMKIFDNDFNLVQQEKVKSTIWGSEGGEIRPSIEVIGNRILSGQSAGQGLGKGNAEVFVYEMQTATSVEDTLEKSNLPGTTNLFQNYPNPFNAITNFGLVSLKVFDLIGREVTTLAHEELSPGIYNVSWIASSNPSGVYVCRLSAGPFIQQRKVLLIR